MAGGLPGTNVPFQLNVKCIIFSMIIIALLLYKLPPTDNKYILYGRLLIVFTISYVSMAWYDYYFDCQSLPLKKGNMSLQQFIKPPAHNEEKQYATDDHKNHTLIYVSHILFIVPFMLYFVYYKENVNKEAYTLLAALSIMTLFYHGYKLIGLKYV